MNLRIICWRIAWPLSLWQLVSQWAVDASATQLSKGVARGAGFGAGGESENWVIRQPNRIGMQNIANGFMDYRYHLDPARGFGTSRKSFASAVSILAQLVGEVRQEVLVIESDKRSELIAEFCLYNCPLICPHFMKIWVFSEETASTAFRVGAAFLYKCLTVPERNNYPENELFMDIFGAPLKVPKTRFSGFFHDPFLNRFERPRMEYFYGQTSKRFSARAED